ETSPRSICSSFLMRLRVDRKGAMAMREHSGTLSDRERRKLRDAAMQDQGADAGDGGTLAGSADLEQTTRECQYSRCIELKTKYGLAPLGLMTNQVWHDDPRRLTFLLARYKFVAKMLSGRRNVGELGCGDAFGTRIVQQEVERVTVYDFDPVFIDDILSRQSPRWPLRALVHDIITGPLPEQHDGLFSLDVREHIARHDEHAYLANLRGSMTSDGLLIIGTPSIESQLHASPLSKAGHVNCKSGKELKALLE